MWYYIYLICCAQTWNIISASWQNQQNGMCAQRRFRSAWAIHPVWSESSLCTQWVAKDPRFLHADSEDSDQTGRMPGLICVFAGGTCRFVGFVMRRLIWQRNLRQTNTHIVKLPIFKIKVYKLSKLKLIIMSYDVHLQVLIFRYWKMNDCQNQHKNEDKGTSLHASVAQKITANIQLHGLRINLDAFHIAS